MQESSSESADGCAEGEEVSHKDEIENTSDVVVAPTLPEIAKERSHVSPEEETNNTSLAKRSLADFYMGNILGEGAYARVYVCKLKSSGKLFAVKVMEKRFVIKEGKISFVNMERKVLSSLSHPLIAHLYFSFHDSRFLYLVLDLCKGGELQSLINFRARENSKLGISNRACCLEDSKFYIAETLSAIQFLHFNGFVHRDLKPENLLLTENGHIKLTDFGTVKDETIAEIQEERGLHKRNSSDSSSRSRKGTFCGTADYVSPEVLNDSDASVGADLWALGCMVYQMLVGMSPFKGDSEYFTFQLIIGHTRDNQIRVPPIEYLEVLPESVESVDFSDTEDLINSLLVASPKMRLGASNNFTPKHVSYDSHTDNGPEKLEGHPFFDQVDFRNIHLSSPPLLPYDNSIAAPTYDGATNEWLLAGDMADMEFASEVETDDLVHELSSFLEPTEKIILDGLVVKRRKIFHTNTRHLMLTTYPRFIYIDPENVVLKGVIPISETTRIEMKGPKTFDIVTPNRNYHLTDVMEDANRWIDALAKARQYLS